MVLNNICVPLISPLSQGGGLSKADYIKFIEGDLHTLVIPEGTTSVKRYMNYYSADITAVSLPSTLITIKIGAFSNSGLTSVVIPENVSAIEGTAFYNNPLTSVRFKGKPTSIAGTAFGNCNNLTDIYVPWAESEVSGAPWGATNATIHYGVTQ